jgi:heptaprenyl diphosphate synthase
MDLSGLDFPALTGDVARVEASLKAAVQVDEPFLTDVATHLIAAGGKRLRPVLALCASYAVCGATGAAHDDVVTGATAVELVHLGSLYHDDVIDEAQTRRGVESVNARWSNITAILAGDFLLARASELAASLGVEVAGLLARTIGELCRGQILELRHAFDVDRDEAAYLGAIAGKTAALMATSCRVGAIVSGVDRPAVEALTAFGHHLGMVFQIVDDVLDLSASDDQLGKRAGNDLYEGIYTLPVILAARRSPALRAQLGAPPDDATVADIREAVIAAGTLDEALAAAVDHLDAGEAALRGVDGLRTDVVDELLGFSRTLLARTS